MDPEYSDSNQELIKISRKTKKSQFPKSVSCDFSIFNLF